MSEGDEPFSIEIQGIAAGRLKDNSSELECLLTAKPFKGSKTRIKRLVGFAPPLYRLRVRDYRNYYGIDKQQVVVLAVLHKKDSERWLKRRS